MRRPPIPPLLRRNRSFRNFWTGQTISLFGDEITLLALPLLAVLQLDAGAVQMGLLTAAALVPNLFFSFHFGAWTDRRRRRKALMVAADLGRALLLLAIPAAAVLGVLSLHPALRRRLCRRLARGPLQRRLQRGFRPARRPR